MKLEYVIEISTKRNEKKSYKAFRRYYTSTFWNKKIENLHALSTMVERSDYPEAVKPNYSTSSSNFISLEEANKAIEDNFKLYQDSYDNEVVNVETQIIIKEIK